MKQPVTLVLPLPESPNKWANHPMQEQRQKNKYRRQAWAAAIQCAMPKAIADLPEHVTLVAKLFVRKKYDEDNAHAAMKWVLDCLKARQTGNLFWRNAAYDEKGYFVDDGPEYLSLAPVTQEVDRRNPRLEVTIIPTVRLSPCRT